MPQDIRKTRRETTSPREEDDEIVGLLMPEYVAGKLGVSKGMVYKLVRTGKLEAVHVGRLVRIVPESYKRFIGQ